MIKSPSMSFYHQILIKKETEIDQKPHLERSLNSQKYGLSKTSQSLLCSKTGSGESIDICSLTTRPSEGENISMLPRGEELVVKRKKVDVSSPKVVTDPRKDVTGKRNKKGVRKYQENTIQKYLKSSQCETKSGLDDRTTGLGTSPKIL